MVRPEAVRAQLEKILASRGFASSDRLSRFLRFTVNASLDGNGSHVKEYVLGIEVFDRKPDYDPRIEPIVRVEARRLRAKLAKYYETEGSNDSILIEYPTGSYMPLFGLRAERRRADAPVSKNEAPAGTIAVLPFSNLSADAENDYFSDGLTEELIHALTKVEQLRVVAWPTAFQFKGRSLDVRQIGEQLQVRSILEGSVRRAGNRLRIAAQLIDVASGVYLWSETYERQMEDIFAIQDEISRSIVDTLRVRLGTARQISRTVPMEAYHLYLKGRFHWNKRTVESMYRAIECFEQAIAVKSDYAAAHAGLADALSYLGGCGIASPEHFMPRARAAALRALEIDETLAEAHASLGSIVASYDRNWEACGRHLRRAIELNPGYATAHRWYSYDYLATLGRLDEALEEARLAQQLDPLSTAIVGYVGHILFFQRRYQEAMEQYQRALDLAPSDYRIKLGVGRALAEMGRYDDAIALFDGLLPGGEFSITKGLLGHALALAGRLDEAEDIAREMIELSKTSYVSPFVVARIYLGFPDKDRAFEWLDKSFDEHDPRLMHLQVAPVFDGLRGDPRYCDLLRKMGLGEGVLTVSSVP